MYNLTILINNVTPNNVKCGVAGIGDPILTNSFFAINEGISLSIYGNSKIIMNVDLELTMDTVAAKLAVLLSHQYGMTKSLYLHKGVSMKGEGEGGEGGGGW